jgi:hypothetical protein
MTEKFLTSTYQFVNTHDQYGLETSEGEAVELKLRAVRDPKTRKVGFEITIPNADALVFPDDLPRLIRAFGWGMASLCWNMQAGSSLSGTRARVWAAAACVCSKVDYVFQDTAHD